MPGLPEPAEFFLKPEVWRKNQYKNGLYRARVVSVNDPESRGRIQVRIFQFHPESQRSGFSIDTNDVSSITQSASAPQQGVPDEHCPWAEPSFAFGGSPNNGFIALPEVGSTVWVGFNQGFTGSPVWIGGWCGTNELPPEFTDPENIRLLKTPGGNLLLFNDTERSILIATPTGNPAVTRFIKLSDESGEITIQTAPGASIIMNDSQTTIQQGNSTLTMDPAGNLVITNAGNTTIDTTGIVSLGTGASLGVLLDTFLTLYNAHTHLDGMSAPTSPPLIPAIPGTHSSLTVQAKL